MFCIYLQQPAIDTLKETNPSGRFWIKLDGTDVKEALQHSAKDKWDGDVDLNDEKLVQLRQAYDFCQAHPLYRLIKRTVQEWQNNCFLIS